MTRCHCLTMSSALFDKKRPTEQVKQACKCDTLTGKTICHSRKIRFNYDTDVVHKRLGQSQTMTLSQHTELTTFLRLYELSQIPVYGLCRRRLINEDFVFDNRRRRSNLYQTLVRSNRPATVPTVLVSNLFPSETTRSLFHYPVF